MDKAGWKTTEFWVTGLVVLGGLFESLGGRASSEWAAVCAALAAGAYAISRAIAKRPAAGASTLMAGDSATVINAPTPVPET